MVFFDVFCLSKLDAGAQAVVSVVVVTAFKVCRQHRGPIILQVLPLLIGLLTAATGTLIEIGSEFLNRWRRGWRWRVGDAGRHAASADYIMKVCAWVVTLG